MATDGQEVFWPQQVQQLIQNSATREMTYEVMRGSAKVELRARADAKNILGVALSPLSSIRGEDISLYPGSVLTSLTDIKDVKLPFMEAVAESYRETIRLTALTVAAFGRTFAGIFSKLALPEDIGGPVQIAVYTHAFVKEGVFALIRFAAILSISLGVINILPIPALDGGRLLFIVIEKLRGRPVNARLESRIH